VRIGETLGGYVIEAEIGSGSMGTVYRARNGGPVAGINPLQGAPAPYWATAIATADVDATHE